MLLAEVTAPIVIFVDEIDTTLGIDFTDDFFVAIRYFAVSRAVKPIFKRLSFVLIGVATPGGLIRDRQRTPFNVGQRVDLTDFTLAEAWPLAKGLGLPQLEAEKVMEWVMGWTGGHPYLTQQLCRALAEKNEDEHQGQALTKRMVNDAVAATFFGAMAERDNNLQFVRGMLTESDHEIYDVLTTYRDVWAGRQPVVDDEQSPIKSHLKLSGVVKQESDKSLRVRNEIYGRVFDGAWVRDNLPVNWRRRIRQLQGTIAASLLVMGILSGLTTWALWERARAEDYSVELEVQNKEVRKQRDRATAEATKATNALTDAQNQKTIAESKEREALAAEKKAEKRREEAEAARKQTEDAKAAEVEQRQRAENALIRAEQGEVAAREQTQVAQQQTLIAQQQTLAAKKATEESEIQALNSDIVAQSLTTDNLLLSKTLNIEALVNGLKTVQDVKNHGSKISLDTKTRAAASLRQVIYSNHAKNRLEGHTSIVYEVRFSPDGQTLASASADGTVRLWSRDGTPLNTLEGHTSSVYDVRFSPDGQTLASASADGTVRLWSRDGTPLNTLEGHTSRVSEVRFSPDGQTLASASDGWHRPLVESRRHAPKHPGRPYE